jgi:hydrogenase nickel incorporation protein HypA/HybF
VHELSIAQEILATSDRVLADHGGARLLRVSVAVGELTAIEPDLLRFAWEALTSGGRDAGSEIEVEWRPARQHCPTCGMDKPRDGGFWLRLCPDCGGVLQVSGGQELDLLRVEMEPGSNAEQAGGAKEAGNG